MCVCGGEAFLGFEELVCLRHISASILTDVNAVNSQYRKDVSVYKQQDVFFASYVSLIMLTSNCAKLP